MIIENSTDFAKALIAHPETLPGLVEAYRCSKQRHLNNRVDSMSIRDAFGEVIMNGGKPQQFGIGGPLPIPSEIDMMKKARRVGKKLAKMSAPLEVQQVAEHAIAACHVSYETQVQRRNRR